MRIVAALTVFLLVQCAPSPERREESAPPRESTASPPTAMSPAPAGAEAAVRVVVEQFGQRLRNVSLLGPRHVLEASIRREYGPYMTDGLLAAWLKDPSKAPGRLTSSPWPERIEIREVRRAAPNRYVVSGDIVESSSGGEAPRRSAARIELVPMGGRWWIDSFKPAAGDAPEQTAPGKPTAKDAAAVIEAYHAAINAGEYERAYRMWENDGAASGKSLDDFRAGFTETAEVRVQIGPPGRLEPAAGSRWIPIPVRVIAKSVKGEAQRYEGVYVLRRSVVDGATAAQREWRISSAKMRRVG